ncbi:MAG: iron-containing alcohol dehydrogenase [Chloroflexota bacterium]
MALEVDYFGSPYIIFNRGALEKLPSVLDEGDKVAIITDKFLVKAGIADRVAEVVKKDGHEVLVWDGAQSDPPMSVLNAGAKVLLDYQPQVVIGLGGGSAMDSAKGAWLLYERPDLMKTYIGSTIYPGVKLGLHKKAKFITIPTTAGTGSDVSWCIVTTDTDLGMKKPLANYEIVPDVAILEPTLTLGMPRELTAAVGMDVIGHAIDGLVARWQTDFSEGMCLQALKLALEWLPKVYENPDDIDAREKMQNAATIAGLGFGNSNTALAHCLAHPIGATFGMHHGKAVSLCLPYSMVFICEEETSPNTPDPQEKLALAARFVGIDAKNSREAVSKLIRKITNLADSLGMPKTLKEAGISEEKMKEELNMLAYIAKLDPNKATTPVKAAGHFEDLFMRVWSGDKRFLD